MADSTLDPDNTPEPDRKLGRGKGTSALGPGDISDSGSDVQGGVRRTGEVGLGLDTGTNEDPDSVSNDPSAGPDIGDAMLDSDTDAMGTGERATAGRDHELAGSDIDIDRIEDNRVILDLTADKARNRWRDESRDRALFEREDQGSSGPGILDRSFSGTYR